MTPRERRLAEAILSDAACSMEDFERIATKWGLTINWAADTYAPVPKEFR